MAHLSQHPSAHFATTYQNCRTQNWSFLRPPPPLSAYAHFNGSTLTVQGTIYNQPCKKDCYHLMAYAINSVGLLDPSTLSEVGTDSQY